VGNRRMQLYELWQEGDDHSFFPADNDSARETLSPGAKLIWRVEATSWEEACHKRNEYLGWDEYRPFQDEPHWPPLGHRVTVYALSPSRAPTPFQREAPGLENVPRATGATRKSPRASRCRSHRRPRVGLRGTASIAGPERLVGRGALPAPRAPP